MEFFMDSFFLFRALVEIGGDDVVRHDEDGALVQGDHHLIRHFIDFLAIRMLKQTDKGVFVC
jgi:hypothetical protein